jgi:sulfatase modifying factor 1
MPTASSAVTPAVSEARTEPASSTVTEKDAASADAGVRPDTPDVATDAGSSAQSSSAPEGEPCPSGMRHVRFDYCPDLSRRCLDKEYDKPNHITICHRFAIEKPECRAPRIALDFCIDEYEYPNRAGAKPPVMLNFFEASGLCAAEQKRLCYESEWVTACEGPDEKPFPYGYERSSKQCNFDNRWVDPHLALVYAKDPEVQRAELARLDRSVPSGQMPGCVSDFGVYDLTGNVDEWALADHDRPREHAKFAALKGGAWGHVRNACRPVTTSHVPEFRYYFIGFRCCKDSAP